MTRFLKLLLSILLVAGTTFSKSEVMAQASPSPTAPARDSAKNASEDEQVRRFRNIVMRPVVYTLPGMEKVKVVSDLQYTGTETQFRKMDVYLPPETARNDHFPAVLFIHGGTNERYSPKDWGIFTSWGRLVAAAGLAGVTFTHRLGFPDTSLAQGASDLDSAISYVRDNADKLHIDKNRLCLMAFSAGGPLLSSAMREKPPYIRCLLGFYAFMDIQQSDVHKKSESPETVKKFSNITYLNESEPSRLPALFIARAGRDDVPTMNDSIDRFVAAALSKNVAITFMNHPDGLHGFDNRNADNRSREIIRAALAFMKAHLAGP